MELTSVLPEHLGSGTVLDNVWLPSDQVPASTNCQRQGNATAFWNLCVKQSSTESAASTEFVMILAVGLGTWHKPPAPPWQAVQCWVGGTCLVQTCSGRSLFFLKGEEKRNKQWGVFVGGGWIWLSAVSSQIALIPVTVSKELCWWKPTRSSALKELCKHRSYFLPCSVHSCIAKTLFFSFWKSTTLLFGINVC